MIRTKIANHSLTANDSTVIIKAQNITKKTIDIDKVLKHGMMLFPKELRDNISSNIKAANQYDKFMDKLFLKNSE